MLQEANNMSTVSQNVKPFYQSSTITSLILALIGAVYPVIIEWIDKKEPPEIEKIMPALIATGALVKAGTNRFRIDEDHPESPIGTPNWLPGRNYKTKFEQKTEEMLKASESFVLSQLTKGGDPASLDSPASNQDSKLVPVSAVANSLNIPIYKDRFILKFKQKSYLKDSTEQSSVDDINDVPVRQGDLFDIYNWQPVDNDHIKVVLVDGTKTKYVYDKHVTISDLGDNILHDTGSIEIEVPADRGPKIKLAGIGEVYLNDPIIPNGHLTWAEVTKNGTRLPTKTEESFLFRYTPSQLVENIILLAEEFEKLRLAWGEPIEITSGFRDYHTNQSIGGASASQHRAGLALDLYHPDIYRLEDFCVSRWPGRIGLAATSGRMFVHIDLFGREVPYLGSDKTFSY